MYFSTTWGIIEEQQGFTEGNKKKGFVVYTITVLFIHYYNGQFHDVCKNILV